MTKTKSEMNSASAAAAMRTIANDGYLAYVEWPVFLAHRLKQVEQHLGVTAAPSLDPEQAAGSFPTASTAPNFVAPAQPPARDAQPSPRSPRKPAASDSSQSRTNSSPVRKAAQAETAKQPAAPMAQSSTSDSAEGNLLRFLENFDMQGEDA